MWEMQGAMADMEVSTSWLPDRDVDHRAGRADSELATAGESCEGFHEPDEEEEGDGASLGMGLGGGHPAIDEDPDGAGGRGKDVTIEGADEGVGGLHGSVDGLVVVEGRRMRAYVLGEGEDVFVHGGELGEGGEGLDGDAACCSYEAKEWKMCSDSEWWGMKQEEKEEEEEEEREELVWTTKRVEA